MEMETMYMCNECKEIFADSDMKRVRHSDGDAWDECPFCGSDDFDEVEQCEHCGNWTAPERVYHGICYDCLADKAEDVRTTLDFGRAYPTTVSINAVYAKAFSNAEIDTILEKAYINMRYGEMTQAALDSVTDDPDVYAEWLVKEERI